MTTPQQRRRNRLMGLILVLIVLAIYAWVFVRGSWLHAWPYPFMDVDALGLGVVLRNSALVCGLFVAGAFALIGIDRLLARTRR